MDSDTMQQHPEVLQHGVVQQQQQQLQVTEEEVRVQEDTRKDNLTDDCGQNISIKMDIPYSLDGLEEIADPKKDPADSSAASAAAAAAAAGEKHNSNDPPEDEILLKIHQHYQQQRQMEEEQQQQKKEQLKDKHQQQQKKEQLKDKHQQQQKQPQLKDKHQQKQQLQLKRSESDELVVLEKPHLEPQTTSESVDTTTYLEAPDLRRTSGIRHASSHLTPTRPGAVAVSGMNYRDDASFDSSRESLIVGIASDIIRPPTPPQQQQQQQVTIVDDNNTASNDMVQARLVSPNDDDDDEENGINCNLQLPRADPVDPGDIRRTNSSSTSPPKKICHHSIRVLFLIAALLGVTLVVATLGIICGRRSNNPSSDNGSNEFNTTNSTATAITAYARNTLQLPDYTIQAIDESETSPQALANQWLLHDLNITGNNNYSIWKQRQRFVLATFFYATGGFNWLFRKDWLNHSVDECFWESRSHPDNPNGTALGYVSDSCNAMGEFIVLSLPRVEMKGTIPRELALLTKLQMVRLFWQSDLGGPIPTELGLLSELNTFNSGVNYHSGTIPTEFALCTNLIEFRTEYSPLIGGIPTEFGVLRSMEILSIQYTQMTDPLPTELYSLTNLTILDINANPFRAASLDGIGRLTNLVELKAYDLPFAGSIPTEIGLLTNLDHLQIHNTQLTGTLPAELFQLTKLTFLRIHHNSLTGSLPFGMEELGRLISLDEFWLGENQFTGTITPDIWGKDGVLPNLTIFKLYDNLISGTIPTEMGLLSSVTELWLQNNPGLVGALPSEFGNLWSVEQLFLHETSLTGTIPLALASLGTPPFNTSFAEEADATPLILTLPATLTGSIPEQLCSAVVDLDKFTCFERFVDEQVCVVPEVKNMTCHDKLLCGCSCVECTNTTAT